MRRLAILTAPALICLIPGAYLLTSRVYPMLAPEALALLAILALAGLAIGAGLLYAPVPVRAGVLSILILVLAWTAGASQIWARWIAWRRPWICLWFRSLPRQWRRRRWWAWPRWHRLAGMPRRWWRPPPGLR